MGTRADFYVGIDENAEWLGSVGCDGYEWAEAPESNLRMAKSKEEFRQAVSDILDRDDATLPKDGWPWPWDDSGLTDYTYHWSEEGVVFTGSEEGGEILGFPDMASSKNVQLGRPSGLIALTR